ncbi:MAG: hypothetical protein LRZ97_00740, partial [Candidatus Pacebacteria bacterium]|nr:hypothetical protein [Candidatus Paceibacterota bacterium]
TGTAWGYGLYKKYMWWYIYIEEDSGFDNRVNLYQRVHAFNPPPFAPSASAVPYLVNWSE